MAEQMNSPPFPNQQQPQCQLPVSGHGNMYMGITNLLQPPFLNPYANYMLPQQIEQMGILGRIDFGEDRHSQQMAEEAIEADSKNAVLYLTEFSCTPGCLRQKAQSTSLVALSDVCEIEIAEKNIPPSSE